MTIRHARLLAFLLDLLVCAAAADAAGLLATAAIWLLAPQWRPAIPAIWGAAALSGIAAFLLRDSRGGRARRWLALEARDARGRPPGALGSIRRNLPLLLPIWNLIEVWPLLSDGGAQRPSDRRRGIRILRSD
jgi:hypothetical protein